MQTLDGGGIDIVVVDGVMMSMAMVEMAGKDKQMSVSLIIYIYAANCSCNQCP